eukprot:UN16378
MDENCWCDTSDGGDDPDDGETYWDDGGFGGYGAGASSYHDEGPGFDFEFEMDFEDVKREFGCMGPHCGPAPMPRHRCSGPSCGPPPPPPCGCGQCPCAPPT